MGMEFIRAFIAIELPHTWQTALADLQAAWQQQDRQIAGQVRWVAPENVHLTLKFLGDVSTSKIATLQTTLRAICQTQTPFQLTMGLPGVFPNPSRPRVLWVGLTGDLPRLQHLAQAIEKGLIPLQFAPEHREFSPHLTLGRVRDTATPAQRQRIGELVTSFQLEHTIARWQNLESLVVQGVNLMRSDLSPSGAHYTRLATLPLHTPSLTNPGIHP